MAARHLAWYSPSISFLDRSFSPLLFVSGVLCTPHMMEQVRMAPHWQCALHNCGHVGLSGCGVLCCLPVHGQHVLHTACSAAHHGHCKHCIFRTFLRVDQHFDTFLRPPFCCGTSSFDLFTAPEVVAVTLVVEVAVVVALAPVITAAPVAPDTVQEIVAAPVAAGADDTAA